jgi:hypothetical protein
VKEGHIINAFETVRRRRQINQGDTLSHDLLGCVPIKALGGRIPAQDRAVQVGRDDGIG